MKVKDIIVGMTYNLSGDIQNGSFVTHDEVRREVVRITDEHIFCKCGRKFTINKNLVVTL